MSNSANPPSGWDHEAALASLQELGLSRTQADLYLTTLAQGPDAEFSTEELAEMTGRGAHNLERSLEALVRHGAIEEVEGHPGRFRVTAGDEFMDMQLERFRERCFRAADLLRSTPSPARELGIIPLTTREEVLAAAHRLLSDCRRHLTVHGSTEFLQDLGSELEKLALSRTVRVLSPVPMTSAAVQIAVCPRMPESIPSPDAAWLQIVVDGESWLAVGPGTESENEPAGWCLEGSTLAAVLGLGLEQAWLSGSAVATQGLTRAATPKIPPAPADEEIMFLVRHDHEKELEAED